MPPLHVRAMPRIVEHAHPATCELTTQGLHAIPYLPAHCIGQQRRVKAHLTQGLGNISGIVDRIAEPSSHLIGSIADYQGRAALGRLAMSPSSTQNMPMICT